MPFPGRRWPTRVAWSFEIRLIKHALVDTVNEIVAARSRIQGRPMVEIMQDADIVQMWNQASVRRLSYIGKPNRYRALEAQRFLQRQPAERVTKSFEVEFDRGGVVFSRTNGEQFTDKVHTAYHPHGGTLGPIDAFSRFIYPKRVGGLWLYSYKDKLTQEELEAFYAWFEKSFKKKLKRPKGRASSMKPQPEPQIDPEGNEFVY